MEFQTKISIPEYSNKIDYDSKIVSIGSCFAVNMASKFKALQFRSCVNPFGILFHPKAIEKLLKNSISDYVFTEKDVFSLYGVWSCFDSHSDLNQLNKQDCIDKLNEALRNFKNEIQEATHIILTFGTAWVYEFLETNSIVANCHKLPQNNFRKRILSYDEIVQSYVNIRKYIHQLNPTAEVIYTISPVRHLKDGFVENQRSKANLIAALHSVLENENQYKSRYFPAYEIIMDELRDYRFYAEDMIHPSSVAIQYIWDRWVETFVDEKTYPIMKKVEEVQRGLNHRSFNPDSEKHNAFLSKLADKIDFLLDNYPHMDFR